MMLKPMNRASLLGFYGGLLGLSIVIFLWGFGTFGTAYDGSGYPANPVSFVIIGCIAAISSIISVLIPTHKPLFIGLLLLIGANLGFYLMNILWLVPGLMMLIGAYRSVKSISKPELLLQTRPVDMRLAKAFIIILTVLGLIALMVGLVIGPRVGAVFHAPTAVPTIKP